jgi:hypothetical protein
VELALLETPTEWTEKRDGCSNIVQNWDQDVQSIPQVKVGETLGLLLVQEKHSLVVAQHHLVQEMVLYLVEAEDHSQMLDGPDLLPRQQLQHLLGLAQEQQLRLLADPFRQGSLEMMSFRSDGRWNTPEEVHH